MSKGMSKGPPHRKGGQGTGHLKNPEAFSGSPKSNHEKTGHPKRGHKHNVKGM